jgi:hypothetical protein
MKNGEWGKGERAKGEEKGLLAVRFFFPLFFISPFPRFPLYQAAFCTRTLLGES